MRSLRVMLAVLGAISIAGTVRAADMTEPGGTTEASQMAMFSPDEFAWKLFFYLSQQAAPGAAGLADASKASFRDYDTDKDVVWESWALASGQEGNRSEVFKRPATKPVPWDDLRKTPSLKVLSHSLKDSPLRHIRGINFDALNAILKSDAGPLFMPFPESAASDETRMNRAVFETVRDKELYSVEGLARRYAAALAEAKQSGQNRRIAGSNLLVTFGQGAKEIKARWRRLVNEQDKARYHWRTIAMTRPDGTIARETWGLVTLHVITRDMPNWFWSDFGHVDMEREAWCTRPVNPVPDTCPRDVTTRGPNATSGRDGVRNETRGTKWENYILRGTQTDFTDAIGRPTILSNPVIEGSFQKSSCISCHALAAFRPPAAGGVERAGSDRSVGVPDSQFFLDGSGEPVFLQVDFLWSIPTRAGNEPGSPSGPASFTLR